MKNSHCLSFFKHFFLCLLALTEAWNFPENTILQLLKTVSSICYKFQGQRKLISQHSVISWVVQRLDSLWSLNEFYKLLQILSMSFSKSECWEFWLNDPVVNGPGFPKIAIWAKADTRPTNQIFPL